MKRESRRLSVLCVPVMVAMITGLSLATAHAVTIDDFEVGPFSLQTTGSGAAGQADVIQSSLPTGNVLGGNRLVAIQSGSTTANATASLTLTAGDDGMLFSAPSSGGGLFILDYGFGAPVDLTGGGALNRFVVDFSQVSTPSAAFDVTLQDINLNFNIYVVANVLSAGQVSILFSDLFFMDLTQITRIQLALQAPASDGGQYVVSDFFTAGPAASAVPEPSTVIVMVVGGLAAWAGRPRRS